MVASIVELIIVSLLIILAIIAFVWNCRSNKKPTEEDYYRMRNIAFLYFLVSMFYIIRNIISRL